MTTLTEQQLDRVRGTLVGTAAGDALGASYEFGPPVPDDVPVTLGGGPTRGWRDGEWTDDTAMAVAVAEVAARGADLRTGAAQDAIVARWVEWSRTAKDVGLQTRRVLAGAGSAAAARAAAEALHARTGRTAGNGSLMRTAPVALRHLDDEDALVAAATALSGLTHADPEAGEACVLWCLAIRHAIGTGTIDARVGLGRLEPARGAVWHARLDEAEASRPADFAENGWVVEALQGAWSAISHSASLAAGLEAAVRGGRDADTVAAIAGGLLGAAHGESAVPGPWRAQLHGWPGLDADGLAALAVAAAGG